MRVALVGLGNMGQGMAARLLAAGHELAVFNRTASRAGWPRRDGATLCTSPRTACQGADAVISMVADDAASAAVWNGPEGILAADTASAAFAIECSTLSHAWVLDLSTQCRARGLRYIDAPVTGLPEAAAAGELTLLVGAETGDLHAASELLTRLSRRIIRFGPVGSGTAYKLVINLIGAIQIASAAEGLAFAERAGLDMVAVAEAIATSQAASPQVVRNTHRMMANDHEAAVVFSAALRLKDVDYAMQYARSIGVNSPFGAVAEKAYRQLCDLGFAHVNESKVIEVFRSGLPAGS